ncbi:two-component system LytT family sensor kinase [Chryseobacterium sp. SORGH_AS909]|uniref:Two-component system LytT family sensor kinase n=2 Tax=Chryseobacterium camelliae TaxID=1265445 RepID=A0ABU0TIP7_9FLAO|nr:two-component system LytT family sensor kinase [Chryseobacterium camelliae]MDQ1100865.1 two-component system LytT family sensor kinase [Chryseobacterium sp. SORGH_AS_1048]MDR6084307.1 two-component system LytT family sensor kinase [Chryseobacterium sp. SORGH_AS_0909]MDR6132578.1 two-component system LytT family sensor kinase [Chryseobacterium sp. SORGH_AS_1175]MDT3409215.1 two-component system LytT family sensor kinase [Pseudacidovorax intermedius]
MNKNERKIYLYSAFLITLMVNSAKLMALNSDGIIARYWQFNIGEYGYQFLYNMGFCILLLYLNLSQGKFLSVYRENKQYWRLYTFNVLILVAAIILGSTIHSLLFGTPQLTGGRIRGYFARFLLSSIMIAVVIRLILLMRESRNKDLINEQLNSAYLKAQLQLLQEQLNPHFLFNTLSSLSAIVRENPNLAQNYILHLSKIFRYTLVHSGNNMVSLEKELEHLKSYIQLVKMRLENAFQIHVNISKDCINKQILHLSLQPLVENAVKHNKATLSNPLTVEIFEEDKWLIIRNNLQPSISETEGTGLGLTNLNERYKLQLHKEIEIFQTKEHFIVKLPLL